MRKREDFFVFESSLSKEQLKNNAGTLGKNVRTIRKQKGFSTKDLAKFLNISPAYLGLIERGERSPGMDAFLRICQFFDVKPASMLKADGLTLSLKEVTSNTGAALRKQKAIMAMLETFDEAELDYIAGMVKNFKAYRKPK